VLEQYPAKVDPLCVLISQLRSERVFFDPLLSLERQVSGTTAVYGKLPFRGKVVLGLLIGPRFILILMVTTSILALSPYVLKVPIKEADGVPYDPSLSYIVVVFLVVYLIGITPRSSV